MRRQPSDWSDWWESIAEVKCDNRKFAARTYLKYPQTGLGSKINEAIWKAIERSWYYSPVIIFTPWHCCLFSPARLWHCISKETPINKLIFKICLPECQLAKGEILLTNSTSDRSCRRSPYQIVLCMSEWDWQCEANKEAVSSRWCFGEKVSGMNAAIRHDLD